jgi:phospholipase D-like protein
MAQVLPALLAVSALAWTLAGIAVVLLFALWVFCLFDVLLRSGRGAASKALWALALILLAPFAIVAYLIVRTRG